METTVHYGDEFDSLIHLQDSQTIITLHLSSVWFDSLIHLQDSQTDLPEKIRKIEFDSLIHLQDSQTHNHG